ncbi:MAG TPA: ABC transporter permease [Vicinamibacterales bacterium]|nr:ABC transporter permease [Vicinamibacterales bacterium]
MTTTRALEAVLVREAKIRATNALFIFWDLVYPLGYLFVFGIGVNASLGFTSGLTGVDYNAFFLAGVLGMASFGIASNTSWSFFLDRDNGIFYEMLTYPMRRSEYLVGKVLFNVFIGMVQALLTLALAAAVLRIDVRFDRLPLLVAATIVGTAGWFFFYAIFALRIRRNDAFNTVTSVFYFFFLFASSMFYPLEPLPPIFRLVARLNPITWQVDVLRYATIGTGSAQLVAIEAVAFVGFTLVSFAAAVWALDRQG